MNETTKTFAFILAAAASVAGAYVLEAKDVAVDVEEFVGSVLNEGIDPAAPRRLKIVKFDRQNAETRQFEVAEVDGVWSIPSKENYPADATRQMAEAATCIIDRKILRVAGQTAESHEQFGVVDPLASNLNSKSKGVGTRVVMSDSDDKTIVDMIVGAKVKDATGQYYVRKSNQDLTYVVELDPEKLSTDFADWIEDDLLKLSAFDIRKVLVNDYSAELKPMLTNGGLRIGVTWDRRGEFTLGYDDADSKWTPVDLKTYDTGSKTMIEAPLAGDEELNQEKLNGLRTALDDLLIVDVARKPAGLSKDLKAGNDFLNNNETVQDLMEKGFSPVPKEPGAEPEILSSEGEVIVTQRDGVEYVLRFGQLQLQTDGEGSDAERDQASAKGEAASAAADVKKSDDKSNAANLRRYLFVMARHNPDVVETPKLKELPELPAAAEAVQEDAKSEEQADEKTGEQKADEANEAANGEENRDADSSDEAKDDQKAEDNDSDDKDAAAERERVIAERKEIEAENQRLLDEYNDTLKAGEKKVTSLNARFGDWYYVISNDVYKQIHLGRGDIVKKDDAPKDGESTADDATSGLPKLPGGGP